MEPFFNVKAEEKKADYGRFVIEPLPQGFGHTIGNSLRRVLLSFIPGTAVTKVKIKGVRHQFSTIAGMKEDVVDLILNIKGINFNCEGEDPVKVKLEKSGAGDILAKDITLPAGVTVANPDHYIASLSSKTAKLSITIWIENGVGYIPSEDRTETEVGVIPVDSMYSSIRRVNFSVAETRVGRATNFDKLTLEIWTNGAIDTEKAIQDAGKILVSYFEHLYDPKESVAPTTTVSSTTQAAMSASVEELDLPVRVVNALKKGGYQTIQDFEGSSRQDLEKVRNLGAKSIDSIIEKIEEKGVTISS